MLREGLRKLWEEVLAQDVGDLSGEGEFDVFVGRAFDRAGVGVVGVEDESAAGFGLDMEVELGGLAFGELYTRGIAGSVAAGQRPGIFCCNSMRVGASSGVRWGRRSGP